MRCREYSRCLPVMTTPETQQRLFVALWPAKDTARALAALAQQYLPRDARPIPRDNLHLTLAFIGSVTMATRRAICDVLETRLGEPFDMCLDRVGAWPQPRVLWLAPSLVPPPLMQLARQVQTVMIPCGYQPESRPFQPHVTLARKLARADAQRVVEKVAAIDWPVHDLVLAQSISTPVAPRYEVLQRWKLG